MASDEYHSREELEALAARVKAGQPAAFDSASIKAGFMREEVNRLAAQYGTVPPPWVVSNEHPYNIGWRMGAGESHRELWWEWWEQQRLTADERIAYFRRWPPPHCWLARLIEAIWGVDRSGGDDRQLPYFERTAALGFGAGRSMNRISPIQNGFGASRSVKTRRRLRECHDDEASA